jgi:predicted lactoylglutathione lyase
VGYGAERPLFWVGEGSASTGGTQIAFTASTREEVVAFYVAALAAGGRDNGAPGLRPHYHPDYYSAFVMDPDGHNIESVCHSRC